MAGRRLVPLLSWVFALACGAAGSDPKVTVRDSAGVEIVESTPPSRDAVPPWVIDPVPAFDIGADQDDPHQMFDRPTEPIRLSDGRIVVGDPGTQEIRFFDGSGRWLATVGRSGSGPGEFTDLRVLVLGPGDSLFAGEPGNGRVTVLDAQGRFRRLVRPPFPGEGRFASFQGVFADGRLLINGSKGGPPERSGRIRSHMTLFAYRGDGTVIDSIAAGPGWEALVQVMPNGWRSTLMPFGRAAVVRTHEDHLYLGDTGEWAVRVFRVPHGLSRIIRVGLPLEPLTRERIEAAIDERVASARGFPGVTEERLTEIRQELSEAPYRDQLPAYDRLTVAANGDLWFREYPETSSEPTRFVVLDSTGRWRAFVTGPARFTPSWIGEDQAIGLWTDADDVVHVRGYKRGMGGG